jgi:Zn-dependent protease with chaperone function
MNTQQPKMKISAGAIALAFAIGGWILRGIVTLSGGLLESRSDLVTVLAGLSVILTFVAVALGLYAVAKSDGKTPALIALALVGIFVILLLAAMVLR